MAHFYAKIQGSRGPASRVGGKSSGIEVRIQGWNVGLDIVAHHDAKRGIDIIRVFKNGGGNDLSPSQELIATIEEGR